MHPENSNNTLGQGIAAEPEPKDVFGPGRAPLPRGAVITNADDWGRDQHTTDCALRCIEGGAISSVSAMVFMGDSERAAAIAKDAGVDAGLHLNLDTEFSAPGRFPNLLEHQDRLARFLSHPFARPIYHPGLAKSFQYVVSAQMDEYERLYGTRPRRIDGHHHMHLAANVVLGGLLPAGAIVRPHFSYEPGEKPLRNRVFRTYQKLVTRRYKTVDHFYSLPPLDRKRLGRIFSLASDAVVEIETHPCNPDELEFLTEGALFELLGERLPASHYVTRSRDVAIG